MNDELTIAESGSGFRTSYMYFLKLTVKKLCAECFARWPQLNKCKPFGQIDIRHAGIKLRSQVAMTACRNVNTYQC